MKKIRQNGKMGSEVAIAKEIGKKKTQKGYRIFLKLFSSCRPLAYLGQWLHTISTMINNCENSEKGCNTKVIESTRRKHVVEVFEKL